MFRFRDGRSGQLRGGHPGWQGRVAGYDVRRGAYFNIETKINPRGDIDPQGIKFSDRTVDPETFARAVARVIIKNGMLDRADIQSFDFRTPLIVQQKFPQIRTVYLFGDFPVFADPNVRAPTTAPICRMKMVRIRDGLRGCFGPIAPRH